MHCSETNWKAAAGYLYVLRLSDAGLAWEYMRRRPNFGCISVRLIDALQPVVLKRPGRVSIMHMRILQALDGLRAGASQKEIAIAIFGAPVVASCWHADSALRARVRHLIRRGRELTGRNDDELLRNVRFLDVLEDRDERRAPWN